MLFSRRQQLAAAALLLALPLQGGCVGMTAQLLYFWNGNKVPAECDALEGKRVAVVCVSRGGTLGPDVVATTLTRLVSQKLALEVKEIEVVTPKKVADWIDSNGWDRLDYREIGRGVEADVVLAIEVEKYSLYDGSTLYKGRADVKVRAIDMTKNGAEIKTWDKAEFAYPKHGNESTTTMSENKFQNEFLAILAQDIARHFHPYEFKDDFARDASMINRR